MEEFRSLNEIVENGENYSISNLGNVRNNETGNILKHAINHREYHRIGLCKSGKRKPYYIHKLVALAFLPNPDSKSDADHIDRNKDNNILENLRWANKSENKQNTSKRKYCTSKFIGVNWCKRQNKWVAKMQIDSKRKFLGYFANEEDAAREYDKHIHSKFQTKNFP